jgi:hypothetical protein
VLEFEGWSWNRKSWPSVTLLPTSTTAMSHVKYDGGQHGHFMLPSDLGDLQIAKLNLRSDNKPLI